MGRRLPVLNSPAPPPEKKADDGAEPVPERPPWHWIGFGTVAIFAVWLPLAYVAGAVNARMQAARFGEGASQDQIALSMQAMGEEERLRLALLQVLPLILGLAFSAFAGGALVGRFGSGPREAAISGVMVTLIVSILAWHGFSGVAVLTSVVVAVVAVAFAAWGGKVGAARRKRLAG